MTFGGDLPFVPSGIHHHLFENLRRKGHHCPRTDGDGCGCISPRRQGLKQVNGTGHNNGQGPAATTESACAKRRCTLHPGVFLPGCRERRSRRDKGGATVPVAANPGFCVRDGSPPGRRQLRWLRSRQPVPPGGRTGKP